MCLASKRVSLRQRDSSRSRSVKMSDGWSIAGAYGVDRQPTRPPGASSRELPRPYGWRVRLGEAPSRAARRRPVPGRPERNNSSHRAAVQALAYPAPLGGAWRLAGAASTTSRTNPFAALSKQASIARTGT